MAEEGKTRQERREERRLKRRRKIQQHGKRLAQIYRDAIRKRQERKR
ncbi:MAG: hypothetical protein R6U89_00570 [Dehalococcoidia bacterium]